MFLLPFLVVIYSLLVAFEVFIIPVVPFTFHHEFDCAIYNLRLRKNPLADIFSAIGTFLLPNQTFIDALFAERVTANGSATAHDVVHAY